MCQKQKSYSPPRAWLIVPHAFEDFLSINLRRIACQTCSARYTEEWYAGQRFLLIIRSPNTHHCDWVSIYSRKWYTSLAWNNGVGVKWVDQHLPKTGSVRNVQTQLVSRWSKNKRCQVRPSRLPIFRRNGGLRNSFAHLMFLSRLLRYGILKKGNKPVVK